MSIKEGDRVRMEDGREGKVITAGRRIDVVYVQLDDNTLGAHAVLCAIDRLTEVDGPRTNT